MEYLKYWKGLYAHSQQGWEGLNSLIKVYYFRCTARGGKSGGKHVQGDKTRVRPLGRWLLRRIVWALGVPWVDIEKEYVNEVGPLRMKDYDANEDNMDVRTGADDADSDVEEEAGIDTDDEDDNNGE